MSIPSPKRHRPEPSNPLHDPSGVEPAAPSQYGPVYGGKPYLPTDYKTRKEIPIMTGVLDYFPLALCEIALISQAGNAQHNPGEALHWARGKSTDEVNTAIRHLMERGNIDADGRRHTGKAAWRILGLLQKEIEEALGAPISRGSWPA